jgi:hypothetical protein
MQSDAIALMSNDTIVPYGVAPNPGSAILYSSKKRGTRMSIVQIEHPVPNFDAWKKAFDSDPVGRERSGVRRYQVLRPIDNPNYAMIDLEFDNSSKAEAFLAAMREVWRRVEGTIMESPRVRIVEVVESKEY